MASLLTCLFLVATVQVFRTDAQCPNQTIVINDGSTKTLMSPNYPDPYPRGFSCEFSISALLNQVVHVSSVEMRLYGDEDNCGDSIEFFDGNSVNDPLIKKACGRDIVSVQSTGQTLRVRYTFDDYREDRGFYLKYWSGPAATTECSGGTKVISVTSNPLMLHLPHMVGNSATTCEYRLNAPTNNDIVYVDIHDWDMPLALSCGRGSMQVYNSQGTTGVKMIDACGPERPFWSVSSSGQYLTIKLTFTSNPPADSKGFYIRTMSKSKTPSSCGDVATMPIGPMSSYLWFPIFSASGARCDKIFLAPKTTAKLTVLHTESNMQQTPCNAPAIPFTAYDEMPGSAQKSLMCMNNQPVFTTSGQNLKLVPTSGSPSPVLLKVASFESYCNGGAPMEMMANNKTKMEMEIEHIQRNSNCMRRIKAPAGDIVQLILKSTLEDNMDCVTVYDGMDSSAPSMLRKCGGFEEVVMSSGQYLTFGVMVNDIATLGEIKVEYFSVMKNASCPKEMNILARREKVNLTTPNFPMEYPLGAMCQWRFVSYRPDFVVVIEVLESDLPEDCTDVAYVNDGETHDNGKLGEWCGNRRPSFRGTGQTLLLTFDADHMSMAGKKGFKFQYYADTPVKRELTPGTDVLTIAGVLTIIVVFFGLVFIIYRLCARRKESRKQREDDRRPITQ